MGGFTLEQDVQAFTTQHLPTLDGEQWRPNDLHFNAAFEATEPWEGERPELLGLGGKLANIRELMGTMPAAMSGIKYEMGTLYEGIPYRSAKLQQWIDDRLGVGSAPWFSHIQGFELRRAFCFGLRENILVEETQGERQWNVAARLCFLYLFARVTESPSLAGAAVAFMPSNRNGTTARNAKHELCAFVSCASEELYPSVAAGRRLVYAAALKTDNISADIVDELTETCSPEGMLELASLLSFFELWRRMDLMFSPKEESVDGHSDRSTSFHK